MNKKAWIVELDGSLIDEIKERDDHEWMIVAGSNVALDFEQFIVSGTTEQVLDFLWEKFSSMVQNFEKAGLKKVHGHESKDDVWTHRSSDHDSWEQEQALAELGCPIYFLFAGAFLSREGEVTISVQAEMKLKHNCHNL